MARRGGVHVTVGDSFQAASPVSKYLPGFPVPRKPVKSYSEGAGVTDTNQAEHLNRCCLVSTSLLYRAVRRDRKESGLLDTRRPTAAEGHWGQRDHRNETK